MLGRITTRRSLLIGIRKLLVYPIQKKIRYDNIYNNNRIIRYSSTISVPLDHPSRRSNAYRIYFAITNSCNRACPWCSTCSKPTGSTYLPYSSYVRSIRTALKTHSKITVQLEGGEPTLHPRFWDMVNYARNQIKCDRIVLCTNGVNIDRNNMKEWVLKFGKYITIKLSINHILLSKDPELINTAKELKELMKQCNIDDNGDRQLVLNVRLRPTLDKRSIEISRKKNKIKIQKQQQQEQQQEQQQINPDEWIRDALDDANITDISNIFYLQKYGFAADENDWSEPYLAGSNFSLINPDGTEHGVDLVSRSEHMRKLTYNDENSRLLFDPNLRKKQYNAFDMKETSTAKHTIKANIFNKDIKLYGNANFSIYSAQKCNAKCPFCVEELRPASRGIDLEDQNKMISHCNDHIYISNLRICLNEVWRYLHPSVSITGGEPSIDTRLPDILRLLSEEFQSNRITMTTNGTGLLDKMRGKAVIDWLGEANLKYLNISRAHSDAVINLKQMRLNHDLYIDTPAGSIESLKEVVTRAEEYGIRVRLSGALLKRTLNSLSNIIEYLNFAKDLHIDNVIFRQLMNTDVDKYILNDAIKFTEKHRILMHPILEEISKDPRFKFKKHVIGYYYYVEVWQYKNVIDVVFEGANLSQIEYIKKENNNKNDSKNDIVHELVYHANGKLASTWQPWDGIFGPK